MSKHEIILGGLFTLLGISLTMIIISLSGGLNVVSSKYEIKPELRIEIINGVSDTTFIYKRYGTK